MRFRSGSQLIGGIAIAVIGGAVSIGSAFSATTSMGAVGWLAEGALCILIGVRLALAGILVVDDGVRVRNFFRGFCLSWSEIERFEIGRWKLLPSVCLIYLRDGRRVHAFGLQESTNFANGSAQKMVDQLTEELARKRSRTVPGTDPSAGRAQRQLFSR